MDKKLATKNNFVKSLRDYLMLIYQTENHFTSGEGPIRVEKIGNAYIGVTRSPDEQEDLTGFYFRKDLCSGFLPSNDSGVLDEVKRFVSKDLEIKLLKETPEHLTLSIKDREYMVTAHIGELYADEISINFYPSLFK